MIIGSVLENKNLENRIAITPDLVKKYISTGFEILIEEEFGVHLGILDNEFTKVGCKVEKRENILKKSDILLQLNLPDDKSLECLKDKSIVIGNFNVSQNFEKINKFKSKILFVKYLIFNNKIYYII